MQHLPPRVAANAERVGTGASSATKATAAATTTTASETTSTASTAKATHLFNLTRDLLLGLTQNANQLSGRLGVLGGEVGVGGTSAASTTSTADLVNVVLSVGGEVVVDNCE